MEKFVIEGGHKLGGTVRPGGSKNEALPCLAATLLTDEEVTLRNVPRIRDVQVMLDIIEDLGGTYNWFEDNAVKVCTKEVLKDLSEREVEVLAALSEGMGNK